MNSQPAVHAASLQHNSRLENPTDIIERIRTNLRAPQSAQPIAAPVASHSQQPAPNTKFQIPTNPIELLSLITAANRELSQAGIKIFIAALSIGEDHPISLSLFTDHTGLSK